MKNKFYAFILCVFCFILFSVNGFAHPGNLQNKGTPEQGHYNSSTGQYHYHHSNIHSGSCSYPSNQCPQNPNNLSASVHHQSDSGGYNIEYNSNNMNYSDSKSIVYNILYVLDELIYWIIVIFLVLRFIIFPLGTILGKIKDFIIDKIQNK